MVKVILRMEGIVFFLLALYAYYMLQENWFLFLLLILTPDISMLGYLINKHWGAITYNLIHNYILGIALISAGYILSIPHLTVLGIIFFAHVGLDRALGFGLKYKTAFTHTHLQKV